MRGMLDGRRLMSMAIRIPSKRGFDAVASKEIPTDEGQEENGVPSINRATNTLMGIHLQVKKGYFATN